CCEILGDQREHLGAMGEASGIGGVGWIQKAAVAKSKGELRPVAVVAGEHRDPTVTGCKVLCRHHRLMGGMRGTLQMSVAVERPSREIREHRNLSVEQAQVDVPSPPGSLALEERSADRQCGGEAAAVVDV